MDVRPKLLVVDDNPLMRLIIKRQLQNNYQLTFASDGSQAWDKLQQPTFFSAILLDWVMPNISGIELLKRIGQSEALTVIPVIMLTSINEDDAMIEAALTGAFDYLIKPTNKTTLLDRLDRALQH